MSSAFDVDCAAASGLFSEVFGEEVTLARAANSTSGVSALWGEQGSEINTQSRFGSKVSFIDRVWIIKKTLYVIASVAVTPSSGDRITDADSVTWEVMSQPGMPACESYAGGTEWLIRTKRIA